MEHGINNPEVIDEIAFDPDNDEIVLIMRAPEEWDDMKSRGAEVKEKMTTYVAFAFGGGLEEQFPEYKGKKIRFQVDVTFMPPEPVLELFEELHEIVSKDNDARLVVNHVVPQ
jgi:hypothetical protein